MHSVRLQSLGRRMLRRGVRHFFDSQTKAPTLQQHLLDQLSGSDMSSRERGIALVVIGTSIDDRECICARRWPR